MPGRQDHNSQDHNVTELNPVLSPRKIDYSLEPEPEPDQAPLAYTSSLSSSSYVLHEHARHPTVPDRPGRSTERVMELLDLTDGANLARKIDQASFVKMHVRTKVHHGAGALGTTWHPAGHVLWLIQYFAIILATVATCVVLVGLRFLLVPLVMSYFVTFLLAPLTDVFERRPHPICGSTCRRRCVRYTSS